MISVGTALQCLRNESMPWHNSHRLNDSGIANLVMVAKPLNHPLAWNGVILASIDGLLTGCLHKLETVGKVETKPASRLMKQFGVF